MLISICSIRKIKLIHKKKLKHTNKTYGGNRPGITAHFPNRSIRFLCHPITIITPSTIQFFVFPFSISEGNPDPQPWAWCHQMSPVKVRALSEVILFCLYSDIFSRHVPSGPTASPQNVFLKICFISNNG